MQVQKFLVTGSLGCIGSWILKLLVEEGTPVTATDSSVNWSRVKLLLSEEQMGRIPFYQLDILDLPGLKRVVELNGITHIIHLAGMQVPFCRANPPLGAQVNVTGTIHVFEAAREFQGQIVGLAFASSVATLGPASSYPAGPVADDVRPAPETLYGVYKVADELASRVYWQDFGVSSVGLRPYIVYGVGRDQGMTSDLTKATLAACASRPYKVKFGGRVLLHYARDVAEVFIRAARAGGGGARICNLGGSIVEVGEFLNSLRGLRPGADLDHDQDRRLPFPYQLDDSGLRSILGPVEYTETTAMIEETARRFDRLLGEGKIDLGQLDG